MTLRIDFYSAAGAKLNVPPLAGVAISALEYSGGVGKIGSFTLTVPAGEGAEVQEGRQVWVYDPELCFKGVILTHEYQESSDGKQVVVVTGLGTEAELQWRSVGLGLVFEDEPFADAVDTVLSGMTFSAGTIDTAPNIAARRFDGRQRWDALAAMADLNNYLLRADHLNDVIDIGAFGDASGLTFTNRRADILTLTDNPSTVPVARVKRVTQAVDIWNKIIPVGQIQGLGGLLLTLSGVTADNVDAVTRLYLPDNGNGTENIAPISPSFDADWASTAGAARLTAGLASVSSAMATETRSAAGDALLNQYVYGPIAAQTITGNISGQMRVQEASAALNHFFRMNVRVFDSTGTTVRGTLLSPATVGTEFSDSALTNHSIPSTALTSVDTQDGDYVVIEIGRTGGLGQADMRVGDAASSDLPENETTTDDLNPWIEFDTLIVPLVGVEETTYEVQSETVNGATQFYIEDATSVAAYGRRERVLQIKDILALGLTQADLTAASATLYAHAVTYLLRHKDPQVAYEVDPIGLQHISGGAPTFKPGQTVRLDYEGTIETEDGREALISVDTDLYVMGYTRRFDEAGGSQWRFTVSTVARELPSDGQIFSDMMREIGVGKMSPIPALTFGSENGIRIDENAIGFEQSDSAVPRAVLYIAEKLQATLPDFVLKLTGYKDNTEMSGQLGAYNGATKYGRHTFSVNEGSDAGASMQAKYGSGDPISFDAFVNASDSAPVLGINGPLFMSKFVTPAQITSSQNNYNPTDLAYAGVLRVSSDSARSITGLMAPTSTSGRILIMTNVGGSTITLSNSSGSSDAANQFLLGADFSLLANRSILLFYDNTASRWRGVSV